jgi:uncharacterized protein YigE (DUF2233 family)
MRLWSATTTHFLVRYLSTALVAIFLTMALSTATANAQFYAETPECHWQSVKSDLDAAETSISFGMLSSARLYLYRSQLRAYTVEVIRAQRFGLRKASVQELCKLAKASVCINASFFDEQSRPLGLIIEKGALIQKVQRGGSLLTGIFQLSRDDVSIISRDQFQQTKIFEAIQAGPRLLSQGTPVAGLKEEDVSGRRSGVCIDQKKRVIFYAVSAPLFGISIREVQQRLLQPDIGCVDALNLDGGSSTQLSGQPFEIASEDEVPVALGFFPIA